MTDYNNKTDDSSQASSRFEHKSQGMRSQSQAEKRAQEAASNSASSSAVQEDKTIKIDRSAYRTAVSSSSKTSQGAPSQRPRQSVQKDSSKNPPASEKSSSKISGSKSRSQTRQPSSGASSQSKIESLYGKPDEKDTAENNPGISVFMNKSDIPAYEIGLIGDDYYIPKEIRSGKVSKISSEQLAELESNASKKRKSSSAKGKKNKKKKTPAQKAIKAVIWLAIWMIVFLIGFIFYRITYKVFYDVAVDPDSTTTIEYTVTSGATDESVYEDLTALGVIDCTEFIYKLRAKVFEAEYIEGTYYISSGYNTEKIINILAGYNYSSDDDE